MSATAERDRAAHECGRDSACTYSSSSARVDWPFGDGASTIALRPLSALMMLFAGVAEGFVGGRVRGDDAHRPHDLDQSTFGILAQNAYRLRALQVAQETNRLATILRDLVRDVADSFVAHGELGERAIARRLDDRPADGKRRLVRLRLRPAVGDCLRGTGAGNESLDNTAHGDERMETRLKRSILRLVRGGIVVNLTQHSLRSEDGRYIVKVLAFARSRMPARTSRKAIAFVAMASLMRPCIRLPTKSPAAMAGKPMPAVSIESAGSNSPPNANTTSRKP